MEDNEKFNDSKNYEWRFVNPEDMETCLPEKVASISDYTSDRFHMTSG